MSGNLAPGLVPMINYDDVLERYKHMRAINFRLNNKVLTRYAARETVEEAARRLGIWEQGRIIFDTEDQVAVLMDYAYYDCFQDGSNAVDRYAAENPPAPGSDEETLVAAMRQAFFSVFRVNKVVTGIGVHVLDILSDRQYFLADVGISGTAEEALVFISRVLPFEDFIMTCGAALPADGAAQTSIGNHLNSMPKSPLDEEPMTREEKADMAASMIRFCLESGSSEDIRYSEAAEDQTENSQMIPFPSADAKAGRNESCPCGSGKKYKRCCGR